VVDSGGFVTSAQFRAGGAFASVGNYMIVNNGGQMSSVGAIFGRGGLCSNNWVYVGGNNATWNLGSSYLSIGGYV